MFTRKGILARHKRYGAQALSVAATRYQLHIALYHVAYALAALAALGVSTGWIR